MRGTVRRSDGMQSEGAGRNIANTRTIVARRQWSDQNLQLIIATEDITQPTDWCFEETWHAVVVHLGGRLQRMESVFSRGPSSAVLPAIGDVWVIPAGQRYAALAQGDRAHFAEFHLPAEAFDGGRIDARVAHRDGFLHQIAERLAQLADRDDDLAVMMRRALIETVSLHFRDAYLRGDPARGSTSARASHAFSGRQRARLAEFLAASLHEPIRLEQLAAVLDISEQQLNQRFKATFGMTPWQYVLRARLAEAARLLDTTTWSVSDIALRTGFSSPSHLATAYRKYFGVKPSERRGVAAPSRPD
jgi:AraC family transcriptional regulator